MTTSKTRLYISPFSPDLLSAVLPVAVQSAATDLSFHHVPTFPENDYGYVTLPTMAAEKIKMKLNGSILKGKKFKVDSARPKKRQREDAAVKPEAKTSSKKASKKQKKDDDVLDGHELTDRQVKRGWTESTDAKKDRRKDEKKRKTKEDKKMKSQPKSKYTDKAECLFRTNVPPNRSTDAGDEGDKKSKKKKSKNAKESVVHEFANTMSHPSFIRSGTEGTNPSATFEEGKGWVDDAGGLKEPASSRTRKDQHKPGQAAGAKEKRKSTKPSQQDQESKVEKPKKAPSTKKAAPTVEESDDWTSSSGESSSDGDTSDSASDDTSSSDGSEESESDEVQQASPLFKKLKAPESKESDEGAEYEPSDKATESEVHPLEALFKRRTSNAPEPKPQLEVNTQFSFFGGNDVESDREDGPTTGPYTPFTKRDIQERGLRSAAPTPDTALPGRQKNWEDIDDAEDDDSIAATPVPKSASGTKPEESDFAKWFWDNRGDNNRAWKKRRRDAAKEERQRENRRRGMKGKS